MIATETGHYVVLSPDGKPVYDEQIADMFEGSVSISEWGYSYVLGKDASAGKLKVLYACGAAGRKLRRGVGLVAVRP